MSASINPLRPVQISAPVHAALRDLAKSSGVTIRSLIESAVIAQHPGLLQSAELSGAAALSQAHAQLFDRIVAAIYSSSNPVEVNLAIDALEGDVEGSSGQQIKIRELAYHLRAAESDIGSFEELLRDYEGGSRR